MQIATTKFKPSQKRTESESSGGRDSTTLLTERNSVTYVRSDYLILYIYSCLSPSNVIRGRDLLRTRERERAPIDEVHVAVT